MHLFWNVLFFAPSVVLLYSSSGLTKTGNYLLLSDSRPTMTSAAPPPLCCCEYISNDGRRAHMCELCCNCAEFDEIVERMIRRVPIPAQLRNRLGATVADRMRIPWPGGARKIPFSMDIFFAVLSVVAFLLLAAQSLILMGISIIFLFFCTVLLYRRCRLFRLPANVFLLLLWTGLFVYLYCIKGVFVVTYRENLVVMTLLLATLYSMHRLTRTQNFPALPTTNSTDVYKRNEATKHYCPACSAHVDRQDHHCVVLNACIHAGNMRCYTIFLLSFLLLSVYVSWLILTTVCIPFFWRGTILIPYDCRFVYDSNINSLPWTFAWLQLLGVLPTAWSLWDALKFFRFGTTRRERRYAEKV